MAEKVTIGLAISNDSLLLGLSPSSLWDNRKETRISLGPTDHIKKMGLFYVFIMSINLYSILKMCDITVDVCIFISKLSYHKISF